MSEPGKKGRGRPRSFDAEKTLDTAMHAYWQQDPADVSLNTVCALAGVSKPALYREFENEDRFMRAVLDRYAEQVLSDMFEILSRELPWAQIRDAITFFASEDPKMESGCVFFKMRAGRHRLGSLTRLRVDEIDTTATAAFAGYFEARRKAGDWKSEHADELVARYLIEQIGLSLTWRAAGKNSSQTKAVLRLALAPLDQ